MALQTLKSSEPILGYQVTERIGAGGYGEVWRAIAPGGIHKAIKFVYGFLDDDRASRELKALARIKEVRHPFLLSLERFEVVDGQLIIVTELADMSLKDRHAACKASGMIGVPRQELLAYLRDAADALDYMRESYSLQHLDVKPENLLLVGGRVKVADFGLVKDIQDTKASLMGGLTPVYAPPEVFDDRPSQFSDQYSLAIVYQELLTDTLPFPGRTTAQLAAQHLQSRPRLGPLPPSDKPIIDRALSKVPEQRFPSSRDLVDALVEAGQSNRRTGAGLPPSAIPQSATGDTKPVAAIETQPAKHDTPAAADRSSAPLRTQTTDEVREELRRSDTDSQRQSPARPSRPRPAPLVSDLPPLAAPVADGIRPALFVGIGGMATVVLRNLRERLHDRLGDPRCLPALGMLLVDTDARSLYQATQGDAQAALDAQQTLALPLRRSEEYRQGSPQLLQWLSRRWLYNIPRSLQTEGLRPLGRLALVDHGPKLVERLRASLQGVTTPEALAASTALCGRAFSSRGPRTFVVASISGGSGGGMALDVACTLRKLLADQGFPGEVPTLLLMHATGRNPAARDLAVANAYAFLTELNHFLTHGYPGEPACAAPPLTAAEAGQTQAYLVHFGDDLCERGLATAAEAVSEYLYLSTVGDGAEWLDASRRDTARPAAAPDEHARLRTFGVCRLGGSAHVIGTASDRLCRGLLDRWSGEQRRGRGAPSGIGSAATRDNAAPAAAHLREADLDRLAAAQVKELRLDVDDLMTGMQQVIHRQVGCDLDTFVEHSVNRLLSGREALAADGGSPAEASDLVAQIDLLFGNTMGDQSDELAPHDVAKAIEEHLKGVARERGATLRAWLVELVESPAVRIKGGLRAADAVVAHLGQMRDAASRMRERTRAELTALRDGLIRGRQRSRVWHGAGSGTANASFAARLAQYGLLSFLDRSVVGVLKFVQLFTWQVSAATDQIKDVRRELSLLAAEFPAHQDADADTAGGETSPLEASLAAVIEQRLPELVAELDQHLQSGFLASQGGLCAGALKGAPFHQALLATLRSEARSAVLRALSAVSISRLVVDQIQGADGSGSLLRSTVSKAAPRLLGCGGARRLLVVTPNDPLADQLQRTFAEICGQAPSLVMDRGTDAFLCHEVSGVPVVNAAAAILDGQPDCAQIAARLQTRVDVPWTNVDE